MNRIRGTKPAKREPQQVALKAGREVVFRGWAHVIPWRFVPRHVISGRSRHFVSVRRRQTLCGGETGFLLRSLFGNFAGARRTLRFKIKNKTLKRRDRREIAAESAEKIRASELRCADSRGRLSPHVRLAFRCFGFLQHV